MENDMKNASNNPVTENMFALLKYIFADYANQLRDNYPNQTIRNAAIIASGVPEFARLGFIELVDTRRGIPKHIPGFLVRRIKRAKHQPIWIPGVNFPDDAMEIYKQMKPFIRNGEVVWRHLRSKRRSSWRWRKP
jgi:hypothetical protein